MTVTNPAEGGALVHAVRRAIVRTGQGRLRPVWRWAYAGLTRAIVAYLRPGARSFTAFLQGSFAGTEPVYGVSDVDIAIVVVTRAERLAIEARWARLCRAIPWLPRLVYVDVYEEAALADHCDGTVLTYGLDRSSTEATAAPALWTWRGNMGLRMRPGLYGPAADWRLVAGRDRRPRQLPRERADELVAAWLELQFWWRHALIASASLAGPALHHAYLCVKCVAEPARIWLWLARGERVSGRGEALRRALRAFPEEEPALRFGLALHESLARTPEPPLGQALECLVGLTARIAALIAGELEWRGSTEVELGASADILLAGEAAAGFQALGSLGAERHAFPLADWGARAVPGPLDQALVLLAGARVDPVTLGTAARLARPGLAPALLVGEVLVLPEVAPRRRLDLMLLRTVQLSGSDPVSFALLDGARRARFPSVPGWSAPDSARRAVAEHAAWLGTALDPGSVEALEVGFNAARAALFLESVEAGEPLLDLTLESIAKRLRTRVPREAGLVAEAHGAYRRSRLEGDPVPATTVEAFARLVRRLRPYAERC